MWESICLPIESFLQNHLLWQTPKKTSGGLLGNASTHAESTTLKAAAVSPTVTGFPLPVLASWCLL